MGTRLNRIMTILYRWVEHWPYDFYAFSSIVSCINELQVGPIHSNATNMEKGFTLNTRNMAEYIVEKRGEVQIYDVMLAPRDGIPFYTQLKVYHSDLFTTTSSSTCTLQSLANTTIIIVHGTSKNRKSSIVVALQTGRISTTSQ